MSSHSNPTRRGGFSLIEVAIALAIFVFGALAIVQIFPPALGVIRNNESRIAATQLGESMLARSAGKPDRVPDAVYDIELDADGNPVLDAEGNPVWIDTPYAVVGTSSRNGSLPAGPTETQFKNSAVNHFKYIRGEKQIVRTGLFDGDPTDSNFVLLNHPYRYNNATTPGVGVGVVRAYKEVALEGVRIDGKGELDFELASDSAGRLIANPLDTDRTYYVSYRWEEGGVVHGVVDEPFVHRGVGGSPSGFVDRVLQGWVDTSVNRILAGNVAIYYREELPFTTPPTEEQAQLGLVNVTSLSGVNVGDVVSFDYLVHDWRVLTDESRPDETGFVSLPIKNLLSDDDLTHTLDITYDSGTLKLRAVSPTLPPESAKSGKIDYSILTPTNPNRRARTVYQALDGWAQQLSVAAKSYIPFYEDTGWTQFRDPVSLPREPWREYLRDGNELIFHPSEAGKSISVSYVTEIGGVNETVDVVLTIKNIESRIGLPPQFDQFFDLVSIVEKLVAPVTITDLKGDAAGNVQSILSVKGLSVQARTAWQDGGGRYNQVIMPGYRTSLQ